MGTQVDECVARTQQAQLVDIASGGGTVHLIIETKGAGWRRCGIWAGSSVT